MTDEQVGQIISEAMERGFADQIQKEAAKKGYKGKDYKKHMKKGEEKTASIGEMKDGVLFSKFTTKDLLEHLAAQFGRKEPIEKDASQKTSREKFASLVEAELARPS